MSNDNRSSNLDQPLQSDVELIKAFFRKTADTDPEAAELLSAFEEMEVIANLLGIPAPSLKLEQRILFDDDPVPPGVGGGFPYSLHIVDVDDAPPTDHELIEREYRLTLRRVINSDLSDTDKNALYDCADNALDCFTADRKRQALAVVAMALAMREMTVSNG